MASPLTRQLLLIPALPRSWPLGPCSSRILQQWFVERNASLPPFSCKAPRTWTVSQGRRKDRPMLLALPRLAVFHFLASQASAFSPAVTKQCDLVSPPWKRKISFRTTHCILFVAGDLICVFSFALQIPKWPCNSLWFPFSRTPPVGVSHLQHGLVQQQVGLRRWDRGAHTRSHSSAALSFSHGFPCET